MPLQVRPLSPTSPTDISLLRSVSNIHLRAWLTNKCYAAIYYGPPSSHPGIIQSMLDRHTKSLTTDATARFAVVVDTDLATQPDTEGMPPPGKVIAMIKYNVFDSSEAESERKDTGERTWPATYCNLALVNSFWAAIVESRKTHGRDLGPHLSIDLLMTDPDHHRRGAGGLLMRYAVAEADRLGLPAMLEASPEGLKLYQSVGFREVGRFYTDLERYADGGDKGDEWSRRHGRVGDGVGKGEGWYPQVIMLRPKAQSS